MKEKKPLYNDQIERRTSITSTKVIVAILMIFFVSFLIFYLILFEKQCSSEPLPSGFVYLHDVIPDIQLSLRYASEENFVGHVIDGYFANVSIISQAAAIGLKKAQNLAKDIGYELVIYDGYRPQKSVNRFVRWSEDSSDPQLKKRFYYPRVNKEETFDLGYIARRSGHTRGSTIDLTLILRGKQVQHSIVPRSRQLNDNSTIFLLDDGTIDVESSFDLFDDASHTNSSLVSSISQQRRLILKTLMDRAGFNNYDKEWWHYTLRNEPFPDTYFDFDIDSLTSSFC